MDTAGQNKEYQKNQSNQEVFQVIQNQQVSDNEKSFEPNLCPNVECSKLQFPCIKCSYNMSCIYGEESLASCEVKTNVQCQGSKIFTHQFSCRYCFLTENWEHDCFGKIYYFNNFKEKY